MVLHESSYCMGGGNSIEPCQSSNTHCSGLWFAHGRLDQERQSKDSRSTRGVMALQRNFDVVISLSRSPTPRQKPAWKVASSTSEQHNHVQSRLMCLSQDVSILTLPQMKKFWCEHRIKPERIQPGPSNVRVHTTARDPKCAHFRVPALQTPPKFHEKTPKRGKKEYKLWREREKRAKFGRVQGRGRAQGPSQIGLKRSWSEQVWPKQVTNLFRPIWPEAVWPEAVLA